MTVTTSTPQSVALAEMDSVTLADLTDRAALLIRTDRKYLVPDGAVTALLEQLGSGAKVLDIDGRRNFDYESTYFDTADLLSYRLSAHGRRRRFKTRSRRYTDTGECWLEVKTRGARGVTVKDRARHPSDARRTITTDAGAFLHDRFQAASITGVAPEDLQPVLTTTYRRSTVLLVRSGARMTVDSQLVWAAPDGTAELGRGLVVVETKGGVSGASDADHALWAMGQRPVTFSKYGTGLAALCPQLPSNKWCRVLHRHVTGPDAKAEGGRTR